MTDTKPEKSKSIIRIFILHIIPLVFSLSTVLSKLASGEDFLSLRFCGFYAGIIVLLGIYAIVWQQLIKHLPLIFAYANKAVTIIWGLIWGYLLFSESITLNKVIGALVVIAGIVVFSLGEKNNDPA